MTIGKKLDLENATSMEEVLRKSVERRDQEKSIPNMTIRPRPPMEGEVPRTQKEEGREIETEQEKIELPNLPKTTGKPKQKEVWVMDPLDFLTEENIKKVGINSDDIQRVFLGEDVEKSIEVLEGITITYKSLSKQEVDQIEDAAIDQDDEKTLKIFKQVEMNTLSKSVVAINGKKIGETEEERARKLQSISNTLFRLLWIWQGVFDKAIELAVTNKDLVKKA